MVTTIPFEVETLSPKMVDKIFDLTERKKVPALILAVPQIGQSLVIAIAIEGVTRFFNLGIIEFINATVGLGEFLIGTDLLEDYLEDYIKVALPPSVVPEKKEESNPISG